MGSAHMAKESLSRYAPRPWGMQPNTSLWRLIATTCAVFGPCLSAYYTIFSKLRVEELRVEELRVEELRVEELRVEELRVEELRVEELRVGELAGAGAFKDALQQIPQFTSLFCQRLYPFIIAIQTSKNLEPVATLVRLFHCYCNFMDKVITAFRSIGLMVIGAYRTRALAKLMRNDLD